MIADDRELLVLAAMAAGIVPASFQDHPVGWYDASREIICQWNPLSDDGDALRLAVKLNLHLGLEDSVANAWPAGQMFKVWATEPHGGDAAAATRRAIVRVAAEIGRGLANKKTREKAC